MPKSFTEWKRGNGDDSSNSSGENSGGASFEEWKKNQEQNSGRQQQKQQPAFDYDRYVNAVYNIYNTTDKIKGFVSGWHSPAAQKPANNAQADLDLLRESRGAPQAVKLSDGTVVAPKDVERYIYNLEHNQPVQTPSIQQNGVIGDPLSAFLGAYRNRSASAEERMDNVIKNLSNGSWEGLTSGSRLAETDLNWLIEDAEKQLAAMKKTDPGYTEMQARINQLRQLKSVYQSRREYAGSFDGEHDYLNAQTAMRGVDMYHQAGKTAEDYYGQAAGEMNSAQEKYKQAEADYNAAKARLDELNMLPGMIDYSTDKNGVLNLPDGRVIRGQDSINNYIAKQAAEIKADLQTKDDALQAAAAEYRQAQGVYSYARTYKYSDITDRQDYQQGLEAGRVKYQQLQQRVAEQRKETEIQANTGNVEAAGYNDRTSDYYTYRMPSDGWTSQDLDTYCYLLNEDEGKAEAYAIEVNFRNRLRLRTKGQDELSGWSYEHPFWGGVGGTLAKVGTSPLGLWDYIGDLVEYGNTGLVMPRAELSPRDYANALESGAARKYNEVGTISGDVPVLGGKGLGDLYMLGNSVAESVAWGKLGKGMMAAGAPEKLVSSTINLGFFGNAASETTQQALARGATPEQALGIGALAGLAEAFGETMSIENLIHMSDPVGARQILLNILTQAGIEGSEEGVTTLINTWSEALVYGDKSDLNQAYLNNLASGMSRDEAKKAAWTEWAENLAFDVFGGMLSGGMSATGNMVLSPAARMGVSNALSSVTRYKGDTQGLMERATTAGGEAADLAAKYQTRGKGLSNRQAAKLDQATWNSIKSGDRDALIGDVKKQILSRATGVFSDVQAQNAAERIVDAVLDGKSELSGAPTEMERQTFQQLREQLSGEKTGWLNTSGLKITENRQLFDNRIRDVQTKDGEKATVKKATMDKGQLKLTVEQNGTEKVVSQSDLDLNDFQRDTLRTLTQVLGDDAAAAYNGMGAGDIYTRASTVMDYATSFAYIRDLFGAKGASEQAALDSNIRGRLTDTQVLQAYNIGKQRGVRQEKARPKSRRGTGKVTMNGGILRTDDGEIKLNGLSSKSRDEFTHSKTYKAIKFIARALGVDVVIFESESDDNGKITGKAQGAYQDGVIYLDWYAGMTDVKEVGKRMLLRTMGHELTHFIQQNANSKYAQLKDFVIQYLAETQGLDFTSMVQKKMDEQGLSLEKAEDEVVADACETMLMDKSAVMQLAQEKPSLWQQIQQWVNDFLDTIGLINADSPEAKAMQGAIDELREIWNAGLIEAVNSREGGTVKVKAKTQTNTKTTTHVNVNARTQTAAETTSQEEKAPATRTNANRMYNKLRVPIENLAGDMNFNRESRTFQHEWAYVQEYANALTQEFLGLVTPVTANNGDIMDYKGFRYSVNKSKVLYVANSEFGKQLRSAVLEKYGDQLQEAAAADEGAKILQGAIDEQKAGEMQVSSAEAQKALDNMSEATQEIVESLGDDATITLNKKGEMLLAESEDKHTVAFSERTYYEGGKDKLIQALKENGHTQEEIDAVIENIEATGDFLEKLAQQYADSHDYQNLKNNLWAGITTNLKTGKQIISALVNNGDYPVNIDLQLICKKRVAYMRMLTRLIDDGVFEKVDFKGAAIADLNAILRDGGFETACLGCFVESRRLQLQAWAETIVEEWNDEVDKRKQNAGSFNFAQGGNKLSAEDILNLSMELESAGKKNDKGNLNLGKGGVKVKMGRLLDKVPSLAQHLTVADLLTPDGLKVLRSYDQNLFSLVKQRYGAASPKIVQDFNPYNSEMADLSFQFVKEMIGGSVTGSKKYTDQAKKELPRKKGESTAEYNRRVETLAVRKYLYDIGGARIQSFSDFMIENVFDYMQIVADLAARELPLHGYSKEAVFLRLFGMTGGKFNGSLIAHVESKMGKEYAGLLPVEEASNGRGLVVEVDGEKYAICFDDYARHVATGSFIQSIGLKDIVALQLDPRYSKNVGSITIGVSDKQILAMLDSPYFRMVIPYHASGMIPEFAKLVGVHNYNDYTDYQTTKVAKCFDLKGNPVEGFWKADGKKVEIDTHFDFNEAVQRLGDARAAANEYLDWCKQRHKVYDGKKLVGYATYQAKFSDSPYGTDFTQHENYYKLLEDFNSYDSIGEASALQGAVTMTLPSEANRLTPEQMDAYKQALRDTGLYTEKEIAKYAKKADMTFQELIAEEVGNRAEYESRQAKVWDETVDKAEKMLLEKYSREDGSKKAATTGGRSAQLSSREKQIINEAVDKAIQTKGDFGTKGNRIPIREASQELIDYVLAASDGEIDLTGKTIALHGSETWHEWSRHSNQKDVDRDQIPFTKRRFANAIDAIINPDYVECIFFDANNRKQKKAFAYAKRTKEGDYIVVEAVGGNNNPDVFPVEILHITKNKWNQWMRQGYTIAEMIFDKNLNMKAALDIPRIKKNRVSVAQFARKRAIASTPPISQFNDSITDESTKSNTPAQFSFGGQRAATANGVSLQQAEQMEKDGKSSEKIRQETGWFRGMDDKWRFEIDNKEMKITKDYSPDKTEYTLGELISHDKLFEAYPRLRNIPVVVEDLGPGTKGYYQTWRDRIAVDTRVFADKKVLKSVLSHEIQHAIQAIEGFTPGASSEYWRENSRKQRDYLQNRVTYLEQQVKKAAEELDPILGKIGYDGYDFDLEAKEWNGEITAEEHEKMLLQFLKEKSPQGYELQKLYDLLQAELKKAKSALYSDPSSYSLYERTAGEIEARDVQKRLSYNEEKRREKRPDIDRKNAVFAMFSVRSSAKTDTELLKNAYQSMLKDKQAVIDQYGKQAQEDLETYQKQAEDFQAKQQEVYDGLQELDRLVREGTDPAAVSAQRQKVTAAEGRMTTALKKLAKLQERPALQQILQREREIERTKTRDRIRESVNKKALRGKIDRLWKDLNRRITSPTEKKHIPVDVMQQAIEVLEALNMDTSREGSMAGERLRSKLLELKQRYEALKNDKDYSMAARYDEFVSEMLGSMIEKVGDTPINKMSADQMEIVYETLKSLDHVIKTKTKIQIGERMAEIREVGQKMIDETRSIDKAKKGWLQAYLNTQLSPERMFNRLGGYHKNSVWNQLYRMLDSGQLKQTQLEMEGSLIFDDLINSKEHARDYKDFVDPSRTVDVGLKDRSGNAVKLTHGMMVSLWMHLQNEQNRRHVVYGGLTIPGLKDYYGGKKAAAAESGVRVGGVLQQIDEINQQIEQEEDPDKILELEEKRDTISEDFTQDLLDAIEKNLTEYDRAWITACREMFDEFSKRVLNETTMQVYGIKRANVENYFPLSVDKHFLQANFDTIVRDFNLENAGFMKERVESRKPVHLFDVSDVAAQQVRRVSQYAGLMPAIRAFNQVLGYTSQSMDSVQSAIFDKFGNSGMDYIENLMADLNGARGHKETGLGAFLNRLRGHMAQSALTLSLRTAMAQAASYPTAASVVGWKALHKALWHGGRNGWLLSKADKDLIQKWSPLLYYRMKGYSSVALGDIARMNDKWSRVWKKARWLTGWIQAMDGATVGRLWYAAEFYVQDKNKDLKKGTDAYYEEVAKVFNDIVEKTQPNYTTMQRPDILRNPNALVKQLTMFMTQRLQNFNIMFDAAATYSTMKADFKAGRNGVTLEDVRQAGIQSRRAFVSQAVAAMTIVAFKALADIIQHSVNAYRDDDDEELKAESISLELLDMFIDTLAGNVLGGGEAWDIAERLIPFFNKTYYGIEVSGIGSINDFTDSILNLYSKAIKEDSKPEWKDYDKVIKNIGTLVGIPWSNGEKFVKGGWYWIQDAINGEFLHFEAGVDRTMAQQATRLYRAYTETDGAKVKKVLSEVPEDKQKDLYTAVRKLIKKRQESGEITVYEAMRQMQKYGNASQQTMQNYIKDLYEKGLLPKNDAIKYLQEYGGRSAESAEKTIREMSAEIDTGVAYSDLSEQYMMGEISAEQAVKILQDYGGKDAATAKTQVEYWDFQKQHPTSGLDFSEYKTYANKFKPIGLTPEQYEDYATRMKTCKGVDANGDGKTDSGSKKAEVVALIDSMDLTPAQKDQMFLANNYAASGLPDAPWNK